MEEVLMVKPLARSRAAKTLITTLKQDLTLAAPKILYFDIENAPNKSWVWGQYDQNVIAHVEEWYMLSVAWQWAGEDTIHVKSLADYKGYKPGTPCDKGLALDLWKLFDEADILIAHNGDAFDIKKANTRFLYHGFAPPSDYQTVDTLKIARKYFKFNSNKLDDLARILGVGRKLKHTGFSLWQDCMDGDQDAWKLMCKYNMQDVQLLKDVYMRLRSWHNRHPNVSTLKGHQGCPVCGATTTQATKRGFYRYPSLSVAQRYRCNQCTKYYLGTRQKASAALAP
jgi:hypothetical protein